MRKQQENDSFMLMNY